MIDCSCDYDMPSFYDKYSPKARKTHQCCECRGQISVGEIYENVSGKWEYFDTFKTCPRCVDLRVWMTNNVPCFCWAHGNLHDDVRETAQYAWEQAGKEVQGLRFGALRRIELIRRRNAAIRSLSSTKGSEQ